VPQMPRDIREPRLQLEALAFFVAVNNVGQRQFGHFRSSPVLDAEHTYTTSGNEVFLGKAQGTPKRHVERGNQAF
jgi:hypothetical protein